MRSSTTRLDASPTLLALVIAHQTRIAARRAATVRDARRAQAARQAEVAAADVLAELERLILPDRAASAGKRSADTPLRIPGTLTPAERAWVLGWHLLAAAGRVHRRASDSGRPKFGERETAKAMASARRVLRELEPLLDGGRCAELRAALTPAAMSLDAQLRAFDQLLAAPRRGSAEIGSVRRR